VVDSRRSLLNYEGLDASRALAFFNDEAVEQEEESLFLWMRAHPYDDLVVLDVTASAACRPVSGFRQPRFPRDQCQQTGGRQQQ
jgi:hypothetical protein